MRHRRLGTSGLQVSEISLGSYQTLGATLDADQSRRLVHRALDLGINLFDTADGYAGGEAERILGRALGEIDRGDWVLATKCFFPRSSSPTNRGLSRKHVIESVERSLRNLRVEHIDLMQCHRFDPHTPLAETIDAMNVLIDQGKVLYWGIGRFEASQVEDACRISAETGRRPPVAHQTIYNMVNRSIEPEVLEVSARSGVGTLVYGALCQGVLTGKYAGDEIPPNSRAARSEARSGMYDLNPETVALAQRLRQIADEGGMSPAQLALGWCLRQPAVSSVIVGATRPEQLAENVKAAGAPLSGELLAKVETALAATAVNSD